MQEVNSVGAGAAAKTPWLSRALQEGAFQLVFDGLLKSVQVRMSHALLSCFFSYFALTPACVKGLSLPCQVERMTTSCLTPCKGVLADAGANALDNRALCGSSKMHE